MSRACFSVGSQAMLTWRTRRRHRMFSYPGGMCKQHFIVSSPTRSASTVHPRRRVEKYYGIICRSMASTIHRNLHSQYNWAKGMLSFLKTEVSDNGL